ncbi:type VI secretion system-associated FHA domain protein TagH [Parasulfitobacter algicola]|uniref:Type VI secretion system-associated FHA domain protein TagH n=1 Tax=Parasulfitobacter algicola TaxID=2614809 RepID=A0ABX2ILF9_9RHOB|nr:type VI secretion system-associated FHA domain protein TagH [Sulfitobacter algicola]NSX53689.1 type VI secretion system-associated FHA domain protein TagH [Sulfitobacter algicola]
MSLLLRFQNSGALPGGQSSVEMMGGTLTIGRGEENDLVLPDPDRTLSKRHCVLEKRNGDYVILDISTNGTFLNYGSERLDDIPTPLNNGDVILVGTFELVVEISNGATAAPEFNAPLPPMDDVPVSPGPTKDALPNHNPISALDDVGDTGADFLDDLLGGPVDPDPHHSLPASQDGMMLDDPFATPLAPIGLSDGTSAPDHSAASQDYFSAPHSTMPTIPDNWEDSLLTPATQTSPTTNASVDNAPLGAASKPVTQSQPDMPPHVHDAALRAFLDAAGAGHIDIPAAEIEQTMARMGRVMAAMITGMRDILMTRASIKSEMRMDRTMINAGGNNPLKFSVSAEQAIESMIRPSVSGYLDADTATAEALNDIKAHEVATMSGMEAALKDLLMRLGPDQLSARIEASSTLGNLLGGKKARYWEAYEKTYAQIARQTEDDFQSAFGKEFARAYEEQLKKL